MKIHPPAHVVVSVSPTLLAETLARALCGNTELEVVIYPDAVPDGSSARRSHYDVGVVTDELPAGVDVDVLICLPSPTSFGLGRVRTRFSERDVVLNDVDAVRRLIDDVRPRQDLVGN